MRPHLAALAAAASIGAAAPVAAQDAYEVVRPGDGQMTCEALVSDMNTIRTEISEIERRTREGAQARQAAGRMGRGLLSGLARGAAAMGYGGALGDGVGGMVASQALAGVANEMANAPLPAPAAAPPEAAESPRHQRLAHLTSLFATRGC
jgi:hypothetical protein